MLRFGFGLLDKLVTHRKTFEFLKINKKPIKNLEENKEKKNSLKKIYI